jgi:hypothetical protein
MPVLGVKDQFEFLQMKGMVRMSYLETSASSVTQGRSCLRTPTRCASRSSARSKPSCSCANTSIRMSRPGGESSHSWRVGTTSVACTAAWATARRWHSSSSTKKHKIHRGAGCPPPGSVVVVISDPPPARGQPAKQHRMEDTCRCKTQMQICPSKRVNLNPTICPTRNGTENALPGSRL